MQREGIVDLFAEPRLNHQAQVLFCGLLSCWPTLKQPQRVCKGRLTAFFHEHNVRYPHIVEQRIQAIVSATALTFDRTVIEPNRLLVEALVQQLQVLLPAVERFDREIDAVARTLPDFVRRLPGCRSRVCPTHGGRPW